MDDFLRVAGRARSPVNDLTAAVEFLGLKRVAGTGNVERAATSAIRDLVGRRFHVVGTWYAPREIAGEPTDPARIEAWLEAAKTEKVIRAIAPGKRGAERDGLIRAAVDTGVWVTNRDGTGAVLMVPDEDGRLAPLADARGVRLEVDFLEASRPTLAEAGRSQSSEKVLLKEVLTAIKERKAWAPEAGDVLVGGDGEDTRMGGAGAELPADAGDAGPEDETGDGKEVASETGGTEAPPDGTGDGEDEGPEDTDVTDVEFSPDQAEGDDEDGGGHKDREDDELALTTAKMDTENETPDARAGADRDLDPSAGEPETAGRFEITELASAEKGRGGRAETVSPNEVLKLIKDWKALQPDMDEVLVGGLDADDPTDEGDARPEDGTGREERFTSEADVKEAPLDGMG